MKELLVAWLVYVLVVWLIAPLVLFPLYLLERRRRERQAQESQAPAAGRSSRGSSRVRSGSGGSGDLSRRDLQNLILLVLELRAERRSGRVDEDVYEDLTVRLEALLRKTSSIDDDDPTWRHRCEEAWSVLAEHQAEPLGPPPWRAPRTEAEEPSTELGPSPALIPPSSPIPEATPLPASETPVPEPQAPASAAPSAPESLPLAAQAVEGRTEQAAETPPTEKARERLAAEKMARPADAATAEQAYAWKPAEPTRVERLMQAVSGWPKLVVPFLVQNIGWFVGGFCFVSGSLFLVSYTKGYVNAFVILASIFLSTGFLIWGGYELRRKRPELSLASGVLMTLAMLLAPLNLVACVRLIVAADAFALQGLAVLVSATVVVGLYLGANLVGGVLEPALRGRHARLFMALASAQLAAPALAHTSHWGWLAVLDATILGLLGYGFWAFTGSWVRSVFVDRRKIAWYGAGLPLYAATVSFVHLTWSFDGVLPDGYYGPFLMAAAGLLFYVDAELKQWATEHAFLSRFTFAVYALSAAALAACLAAPEARTLTLIVGVGIYGLVVLKYLTVPPLYLLLGASAWLYESALLRHLDHEVWLLASLPGLAALFAVFRWTYAQSRALALVAFRVLGLLTLGLAAWSLLHSGPGILAMSSALIAAAVSFKLMHAAPELLPVRGMVEGAQATAGPWLYIVPTLVTLAAGYAPRWPALVPETQFAVLLAALAALWTWLAFHRRFGQNGPTVETLSNSALLTVGLAVIVAVGTLLEGWPEFTVLAGTTVVLFMTGAVLLRLALALRLQPLAYGMLAVFAGAGAVVKLGWFPGPPMGVAELIAVVGLWGVIRWLDRASDAAVDVANDETEIRVLWHFPVCLPDQGRGRS